MLQNLAHAAVHCAPFAIKVMLPLYLIRSLNFALFLFQKNSQDFQTVFFPVVTGFVKVN